MSLVPEDMVWWITAIDLPALAGLFWLIWRTRQESEDAVDELQQRLDHRSDQMREALSAFKLEVAKTYASQTDMRELESRLVGHLLRIESKLDATALKTAALGKKK
jgi:hypothetical protein